MLPIHSAESGSSHSSRSIARLEPTETKGVSKLLYFYIALIPPFTFCSRLRNHPPTGPPRTRQYQQQLAVRVSTNCVCDYIKYAADHATRSLCFPRGLLPMPHAGEVEECPEAIEYQANKREAGGEGQSSVRQPLSSSVCSFEEARKHV